MADQSVFDKIHVDERDKADLGGVLEQLNLPPAVIEFVRKNQRTIYIVIGVITAVVVTWALYDSYHDKKIAESSSALSVAQKIEGDDKVAALQDVVNDYAGTAAARWAKIELARHFTSKADNAAALQHYQDVRQSIDDTNPLFALVVFGIAQAEEALSNYDSAVQEYSILKTINGFESIGYTGAARIYEVQGKNDSAVQELEEYLGTLIGDAPESAEKIYTSEKISRLKESQ